MQILQTIENMGLAEKPVCIHASLRSFGCYVSGLLESFLESGCTVMVPAFSDMYEAPPVPEFMPERNGAGDYAYFFQKEYVDGAAYSPESNLLTLEEMGCFPKMVLENTMRLRGNNALNSFAAVGPLAYELISDQTNADVYAPFRKLYELDGMVLLMGTDLRSATAIHYAEQLSGRAPFVRWAKDKNGNTIPVRTGGCSVGFENLSAMLQPYERCCTVNKSLWRCYRIRDLVDVCVQAFQKDPLVTHCADMNCSRCNDAAKGGPLVLDL